MKIFITGATGFIGRRLTAELLGSGHQVTAVGRSIPSDFKTADFTFILGSTTEPGQWQEALTGTDVVINLAGATVSTRWTEEQKRLIYDSRILTTRNIVQALPKKDILLISTSATGYYGDRKEEILMENALPGTGFLSRLAVDWEQEALSAQQKGARVVITRFGIVLGKNGGALQRMVPFFKWGLGGPLGSGKQWFPWIHLEDLIAALLLVIADERIEGPVNLTTPIPIRQKKLADAIGRELKRPSFMPAPGFALRLLLGEFGDSLLHSQKVIPDKLIRNGFKFRFMEISPALKDILH